MFRVDSIHLSVRGRLSEQRSQEKLAEPVKSTTKVVRRDIEVVIGVVTAGEGIEAATMLTEELAVLILIRKLLSSQEQHVLTEVGQPRKLLRVRHVSNMNI